LLVNMYMPSLDLLIDDRREKIDQRIAALFFEVAAAIETGRVNHHALTLDETERLLREGKDAALKRMGNAIGRRNDDEDYAYFRMREQQFELLRGIVHHAEELVLVVEEGKKVADFFRTIGDNVRPEADAMVYISELEALLTRFRASALPVTREEFEVRSALLHMLQEAEQYLRLKQRYVNQKK
ncbi:MAG: aromatic acid exporter family protein, partial [Exiguobacterium acetylicum]